VQHGEEDRPLQREAVLARRCELLDDGPIRRLAILSVASSCAAESTIALVENRAPDRNSRSSWPLACNSS
jgi:hypothetical protein